MPQFVVPRPLNSGDRVRIVAPSGPFDRALFDRGVEWLATHFRVDYDPGIFDREGFFAGSDQRRREELDAALGCPETRAVIAARGGHGATRIAANANFVALRRYPKWIVGFSDITALHLEAQRHGVASLHAHNVTGLGRAQPGEREDWLVATTTNYFEARHVLERLTPGRAQGPLLGGNLTLLQHTLVTGRLPDLTGCILFLEEVAEAAYRVDRMLSALERGGAFDGVQALVVGELLDASAPQSGPDVRQIFSDLGRRTGLPVALGVPSGHGPRNAPLPLGGAATLLGDVFTIRR